MAACETSLVAQRPSGIRTICALFSVLALAGCYPGDSTHEAGRFAEVGTAADWANPGGGTDESGYSRLDGINRDNVVKLGLAWSLDLDEQTLEATPLAVDGVLYFTGSRATVYAVDAATGHTLWEHDAELSKHRPEALRYIFGVNRGAAYANGRVFAGTLDGRLQAFDAKSGNQLWSVETVAPDSVQTVTGAPRVFKDMVIIGNGGADFGARGYVTAYDQATGKQRWRFYTVPGKPEENAGNPAMEMAAKTWGPDHWKVSGGGGTVWNGITYDPELDRIYIGTGNSGPYNPRVRDPGGGDNLFLTSIVALDAGTGKYVWHYQVNPREAWDYKATANMIATTLTIDGRPRKVLMQAPTNGFFYVLDRETGKLISAEKIGKVTWASHIDLKTGRPVERPNIRYETGETTFWPSALGAHNWQPMTYSPQAGLVYIPYMQLGMRYKLVPGSNSTLGGLDIAFAQDDSRDGKGELVAWDPVAQKARWRVPHETIWNGGTLTTAGGLVFQGAGGGHLSAYDAKDGKKLWDFNARLGIIGAPMSYSIKGEQYVSILVGYGAGAMMGKLFNYGWKYGAQPRRLLTFKIGGKAALPITAPPDMSVHPVDDPALKLDEKKAAQGHSLFLGKCAICHGLNLESVGAPAPDLRESALALDRNAVAQVLKGALADRGMPAFPELSDPEIEAVYMYIRATARKGADNRSSTENVSGSRF